MYVAERDVGFLHRRRVAGNSSVAGEGAENSSFAETGTCA